MTCEKCHDKKVLLENGKQVICICQLKDILKHRYQEIPTDLKEKNWTDYTGDNILNNKEIRVQNWQQARDIAFGYCFSKKTVDKLLTCHLSFKKMKKILDHRISSSQIVKRFEEGANLAIMGHDFTGKTLLAALIAKEILLASVLLKDMDVKWVSFTKIINSLSLNFNRVNYDFIDEISCVEFLIIDNVYAPHQENYMKNEIDELFCSRQNEGLPIILTGTQDVSSDHERNREILGDEFYRFLNSQKTQKIVLKQLE